MRTRTPWPTMIGAAVLISLAPHGSQAGPRGWRNAIPGPSYNAMVPRGPYGVPYNDTVQEPYGHGPTPNWGWDPSYYCGPVTHAAGACDIEIGPRGPIVVDPRDGRLIAGIP